MGKHIKKKGICKIRNCNRKSKVKGWCVKHYNIQYKRKHRDNAKEWLKDNKEEVGMIYFMQAGNNAIKIGWTNDKVEERLSSLQTAHYEELRILYFFKGSLTTERKLHFWGRKYHIRGEWFNNKILENKKIMEMINKREKIQIEPESKIERHTLKKLRTLRKTNGLMGMKELANKIGVTVRTIYRWESGESMPQRHFNEKLISILNGKLENDDFET